MNPGQSSLPSIKVVPGRSKLRVESSNPVPRGNPIPRASKVKLISPEEAMKLTSGASQKAVSPISEVPRPMPAQATSQVRQSAPVHRIPEAPRPVRPSLTSKTPKPVLATNPTAGFREIVCGLEAFSVTTTTKRPRTRRGCNQSKNVEPRSPRALEIRSGVKQQAGNVTKVVQGSVVEGGDKAKDYGPKEICRSISDEELSKLLLYRPAQHPTWKGRIMDSATPPEFDCEFLAKPASTISRKAYRLSTAMPALLKAELLPTYDILNNVLDKIPTLLNVGMYFFPDEKKTERFKGEHAYLFEVMASCDAILKVNINDSDLFIFSSKLLDKTSQFLINKQKKTENFLWGFFLQSKNSIPIVPETAYQSKDLDYGDVADMDLDIKNPIPSVALKLIAESQSTPSTSAGKKNSEVSLPPGYEKIWTRPSVKLNIQGTSNPRSHVYGCAGLVRDQSGKWVFGYTRCQRGISEIAAGLLAMYHGLKILWDSGFRRIHLETTSSGIIDALTTKSDLCLKRKSILGACMDMKVKDWECEICLISKEQNSCAEWLASRLENQPQGFVFFEYPPQGLMDLLEKDRIAAI